MTTKITAFLIGALALLLAQGAAAKSAKDSAPAGDPKDAAVPAEPGQTSASFGDWVVRCERVAPGGGQGGQGDAGKRVCEAAQSLVLKGQQGPIAQIAFGRGGTPDMMLTVLLPTNITFDKPPSLGPDEAHMSPLAFRRCLPGGCLASAKLDTAGLRTLREAGKPGRLTFTDAAERTLTLPVSFRGLAQALDDLSREAAR